MENGSSREVWKRFLVLFCFVSWAKHIAFSWQTQFRGALFKLGSSLSCQFNQINGLGNCTYLEPLRCCCVVADLDDRECFIARFLSGCDLWSLFRCRWSVLFGIEDVEPLELWRGCCCGSCCCWWIDGIFGTPLLLLLLPLPPVRDGIGPFVLLVEDRCAGWNGFRSGGTLRSPRSFLCCLFELDPDAVLSDEDDACCINFWCEDDDEEEFLWSPAQQNRILITQHSALDSLHLNDSERFVDIYPTNALKIVVWSDDG